MKRKIKDSVFTYLFKQPEYRFELYKALHPEDTTIKATDMELITLEKILSDGLYNDLAMLVRTMIIMFCEAQSTFSPNIALRLYLYVAATLKEYIIKHDLDLHSSTALQIPRPELVMVYSGDIKTIKDTVRLSELYMDKGNDGNNVGGIELTIRVLREDGSGSIIDQYVQFCKISNEQRRKYGYTQKAVEETIRICIEQNVLKEFLMARKVELSDIMISLFDQDEVTAVRERRIRREEREKALVEGREMERENNIMGTINILKNLSLSRDKVKAALMQNYNLTPEAADQKLSQYWNV